MDDALGVGVGQRVADTQEDVEHSGAGPTLLSGPRETNDLAQVLSVDELHREVDATFVVQPELVHGHDPGVVELTGDLRLLEEPTERSRLRADRPRARVARFCAQDFHRQDALEIAIEDAQHGSLPAARDLLVDVVPASSGPPQGELAYPIRPHDGPRVGRRITAVDGYSVEDRLHPVRHTCDRTRVGRRLLPTDPSLRGAAVAPAPDGGGARRVGRSRHPHPLRAR